MSDNNHYFMEDAGKVAKRKGLNKNEFTFTGPDKKLEAEFMC